MKTWEILMEMYRQADISRDMMHSESLRCIERYDWQNYEKLRKSCENMHNYIMTIIDML